MLILSLALATLSIKAIPTYSSRPTEVRQAYGFWFLTFSERERASYVANKEDGDVHTLYSSLPGSFNCVCGIS